MGAKDKGHIDIVNGPSRSYQNPSLEDTNPHPLDGGFFMHGLALREIGQAL